MLTGPGQCVGKLGTCQRNHTAKLTKEQNPNLVVIAPGLLHGDLKRARK